MARKIKIDCCDEHDQIVIYIDGKQVVQRDNDNAIEVLSEIANYLGWDLEYNNLSGDEYADKHA